VYRLSIEIEVRRGNLEQAMRVLKRKVQKEGIVKELKMRQYFEKPSEKKRRKKKENIANVRKRMKKLARIRGY
jgi:small subunit ribosomal protein S21|tara:strand:- start:104 stop:322 length:219 start_codon:yes stop_codon:yes gene_type:complete